MARSLWFTKLLIRSGIAGFLPVARRLTDGGTAYLRYYSDAVLSAPIEELLDAAYFPTPGADAIDLNLPAPRSDSGASLGRVTADRRGNPPTWGTLELRAAIAEAYLRRDGRAVDPEREVFVTHGATAAFAAALDAFANPGDRIVLFDPSSPLFALGARSRRADVRWVPTRNDEGRCRYDAKDLEKAMRRARMLVLSDPANPTGASFGPDEREHIAKVAAQFDVLIYADESFARYGYDGPVRSLAALPGGDTRVLTAGSVAQGWGLASARVGWLAGPRHLVRACALTANLHAPYVPAVCQQLAARALATSDAEFAAILEQFRGKRQYAVDRLRALGLAPEWPAGGYFAWVSVAEFGMDGRGFAERLLKEQQVLVGPGCAFGPSGTNCVRISIAADDGRLREGLARLAAFVEGLRDAPNRQRVTDPCATSGPSLCKVELPLFPNRHFAVGTLHLTYGARRVPTGEVATSGRADPRVPRSSSASRP